MFSAILFSFLKLEIGSGANPLTPARERGGGTGQSRLRVFNMGPIFRGWRAAISGDGTLVWRPDGLPQ
jgi:hypothetical protein